MGIMRDRERDRERNRDRQTEGGTEIETGRDRERERDTQRETDRGGVYICLPWSNVNISHKIACYLVMIVCFEVGLKYRQKLFGICL